MSSKNGGTGDDYGTSCADADRTTFSDDAAIAITAGTPAFRGSFRPELPLSVYRGKFGSDANGAWRLSISDDTAGGVGTLHCWSISIFPTVCGPGGGECEQCGGPFVGAINSGDAVQNNRLTRDGVVSSCAASKACPGEVSPPPAGLRMHLAPIWGAVFRALSVPLDAAQRLFLWSTARGVLSAAVRLGLAGTHEAQSMLAGFSPLLDEVHAACAPLGLESLAQPAPLADLLQATHDRLYSRLFQS